MPKKLISVRLSEDLVEKIDAYRQVPNANALWRTKSRNYYSSTYGGYCSRCDVIEAALKYFFENHKN